MTNPMLAELDEVVRLSERATPGPWLYRGKSNSWHKPPPEGTNYSYGEFILGMDSDSEDDGNGYDEAFLIAAVQFMSTHAPTLADMAKRLEAAERDAALLAAAECRAEKAVGGNGVRFELRFDPLVVRDGSLREYLQHAIDATQEGEG